MALPYPVVSMTGFARTEGQFEGCSWTFEVKSVNGRTLDLRFRLPGGFDGLEPLARTEIGRRFKRGSLNLALTVNRTAGGGQVRINRPLLDQLIALAREVAGDDRTPLRLDGLLGVRGVIEVADEGEGATLAQLEAPLTAGLRLALDRLAAARAEEGARLAEVLDRLLTEIAALVTAAAASAATQPAVLRERLLAQLATLTGAVPALPEERLAQELALLVARGDVREELDRLAAHIAAARDLLAAGDAVGRRLDFLCQEFNREANTLCSKSSDTDLTRIGLALKAAIEQLREQVQNIE
ncbi:MAG: YicC/YloC family endoribonuclease [Rhodospirillaceae bacterium]